MSKKCSNYVDVLDVDREIAGQKFCCISFLSPENILKKKDIFFFEEFVKNWEFTKAVQKYNQFVNFISYKYKLNPTQINKDFEDFILDEKENLTKENEIMNDYKNFLDINEEKLNNAFNKQHNFQTSTRGVKIRGVYSTDEEAKLRCSLLREADPNHDIYVGEVGQWLVWNPEAYKLKNVEYLEEELNQLMHEKNKNDEKAKAFFSERVKDAKQQAIKENIEKAEKTGNKLTQTITETGDLVSASSLFDPTQSSMFIAPADQSNSETITVSELQKQLFEDPDVVTDIKASNHGLTDGIKKQLNIA